MPDWILEKVSALPALEQIATGEVETLEGSSEPKPAEVGMEDEDEEGIEQAVTGFGGAAPAAAKPKAAKPKAEKPETAKPKKGKPKAQAEEEDDDDDDGDPFDDLDLELVDEDLEAI